MSWPRRALFAVALCLVLIGGCGSSPAIDEEFPPGNPVVDESTSDLGAAAASGNGSSDQVLLAILALCLIGAGVLLVRVERWERRRTQARPLTE